MGAITIHSKRLFTLYPDGSVLRELLFEYGEWNKHRIGEYKKFEIELSSDQTLADSIIYFSPALFFDQSSGVSPYIFGGIPTSGFLYIVDPSATMGVYPMAPYNGLPYTTELLKNWSVEIEIGYGNDFKISMKYFQAQDREGFLSTTSQYNHDKLLKDKVSSVSELTVTPNSIYTTDKWGISAYVYQAALSAPAITSYRQINFDQYQAGFYAKDAHEAPPYMTGEEFILETSAGAVAGLSLLENTKVRFRVTNVSNLVDKVFAWVIRTDKADNSVNFKTNYEASFANIVDFPTAGTTLDNKIVSPAAAPFTSTGKKEVYFHIDKATLTANARYRIICIAYDSTDLPILVNSFISPEYLVEAPAFTGEGYDLSAKLRDYLNDYEGNNLTCCIEERLQSIVNVGYGPSAFSDDILNRLGLIVPNDIRRYLTKVTVEIYQEIGTTRHYLERAIAYKSSPTTYVTPAGMVLNFTSNNLEVTYGWRNRCDAAIPNIETTVSGIIVPSSSNEYWGGKTLKVLTRLELYYDDIAVPFSDELAFEQQITVRDYDRNKDLKIFKHGTETEPNNNEYFCPDDTNCFDGYYNGQTASGFDYLLITTADKLPGSVTTIEENEEDTGILPQSDSNKFTNQDQYFSDNELNRAHFCLDGTKFIYDAFYKITVIAKRVQTPESFRTLITGEIRTLTTGEARTTAD